MRCVKVLVALKVIAVVVNLVFSCETILSDIVKCENLLQAVSEWQEVWKEVFIGANNQTPSNVFSAELIKEPRDLMEIHILGSLVGIEPYSFTHFKKLTLLDLMHNNMTIIKANTFNGLNGVRGIYLHFNKITTIQKYAFNGTVVYSVNLSFNNLTEIMRNQYPEGLKELIMNNNELDYIEPHSLPTSLQNLNLQSNNIKYIDKNALAFLTKLQKLNLSHNKISTVVKIDTLRDLKELDLSYNFINSSDKNVFGSYTKLKILNLRNNKIPYLSADLFPENSNIRELYLARNLLAMLDSNLANNLPKLETISIFGNPWNCKCLDKIMSYFNHNNIILADRQSSAVTRGSVPSCIIYNSVCMQPNLEEYKEAVDQYLSLTKHINC